MKKSGNLNSDQAHKNLVRNVLMAKKVAAMVLAGEAKTVAEAYAILDSKAVQEKRNG
jgi:hypothetical protein